MIDKREKIEQGWGIIGKREIHKHLMTFKNNLQVRALTVG